MPSAWASRHGNWLQWPIYALAALVWITVTQRMLFVRRQLRELAEA